MDKQFGLAWPGLAGELGRAAVGKNRVFGKLALGGLEDL